MAQHPAKRLRFRWTVHFDWTTERRPHMTRRRFSVDIRRESKPNYSKFYLVGRLLVAFVATFLGSLTFRLIMANAFSTIFPDMQLPFPP